MLNNEQIQYLLSNLSDASYTYEIVQSPNKIYMIKYHTKLVTSILKTTKPEMVDRVKVANAINVTTVMTGNFTEEQKLAVKNQMLIKFLKDGIR